jgi:hypothetical protein
MKPWVLEGYLVGYKAFNIWLIWIPSKQWIETARDVIFDELKLYDPTQPFLKDEIEEASPTQLTETHEISGNSEWELLAIDNWDFDTEELNTEGLATEDAVWTAEGGQRILL